MTKEIKLKINVRADDREALIKALEEVMDDIQDIPLVGFIAGGGKGFDFSADFENKKK